MIFVFSIQGSFGKYVLYLYMCVCRIVLLCVSQPKHNYKLSCKLGPESVNPTVILDASTPKVFINYYYYFYYYLKSFKCIFFITLENYFIWRSK